MSHLMLNLHLLHHPLIIFFVSSIISILPVKLIHLVYDLLLLLLFYLYQHPPNRYVNLQDNNFQQQVDVQLMAKLVYNLIYVFVIIDHLNLYKMFYYFDMLYINLMLFIYLFYQLLIYYLFLILFQNHNYLYIHLILKNIIYYIFYHLRELLLLFMFLMHNVLFLLCYIFQMYHLLGGRCMHLIFVHLLDILNNSYNRL